MKRKRAKGSIRKVLKRVFFGRYELQVHEIKFPEDPALRSLMDAALEAVDRGETARAAQIAREVWRRGQGDKVVGVWAGQMLAKFGNPEEAAAIYCATERVEAGSWEAYWNLGLFLASLGMHERALWHLEQAVRVEPRAVDAHLDLARCLKALGRRGEARAHVDEARRLDPDRDPEKLL